MKTTSRILLSISGLALAIAPANAAVIASTNFNGRVLAQTLVANDTATNLNWTTNGVLDPGNLSARRWDGIGQALFNTTLTQNMFAPALNVANASSDDTRSWTTTISLAVISGFSITLESVSFDYWAIGGTGTQNPSRNSDFVVTLFSPTDTDLGSVAVNDVFNGATPGAGTPVTLTFLSPVALVDPGAYTLRIRGGDIDNNEAGNHTAIDNLSVNGTVIPEPSSLALLALGMTGLIVRRRRA